jgi:hypothetical protein
LPDSSRPFTKELDSPTPIADERGSSGIFKLMRALKNIHRCNLIKIIVIEDFWFFSEISS